MVNKAQNAKDYRSTLEQELKSIKAQGVISDDIKAVLSADELDLIQEKRAQSATIEAREKLDFVKDTDDYKEAKETKKQSQELVKKLMELTGKSKEEAEEVVYGKSETNESKEDLLETVQSKKRDSMFSYAEKNNQKHAERIEGWLGTINELCAKGIITDSSEGVNVKGLCSFASTESHNKVLEENFGDKVKEPFDWKNHTGNQSKLNTVRKDDLDKKMKKGLEGNYKLESKEFITNTIFPWIEQNFEGVINQDDQLYILQLINPDLFTRLWLDNKNSAGHSRQAVKLFRVLNYSYFSGIYFDYSRGGVFLVGNA